MLINQIKYNTLYKHKHYSLYNKTLNDAYGLSDSFDDLTRMLVNNKETDFLQYSYIIALATHINLTSKYSRSSPLSSVYRGFRVKVLLCGVMKPQRLFHYEKSSQEDIDFYKNRLGFEISTYVRELWKHSDDYRLDLLC